MVRIIPEIKVKRCIECPCRMYNGQVEYCKYPDTKSGRSIPYDEKMKDFPSICKLKEEE